MKRFHNLDFLRSFAMIMGLFIHAHLLYIIPDLAKNFEIENVAQPEDWVIIITDFISNWRMPLFFLLSGFFSALVIERNGASYFIKDRIIRIGLTCLLFSAFYDILDGCFDFTTTHLWFLYELMIFVLSFFLLYKVQIIKSILSKMVSTKVFFIVSIWLITTVPLAHILNNSFHPLAINPSETYFDLKPGNLLYYFSYFMVGVSLYSNQRIFNILAENKNISALAILSVLAFFLKLYVGYLTVGEVEDFRSLILIQFEPNLVLLYAFSKGINTVLWCLFFIAFASKFIKSGSAILSWFVELSYPVYLVHLLPLVIVSTVFYHAGFSQISSFLLTIIICFTVCIVLYYVFIKFTPLNWLMNGYHKSFFKLKLMRDHHKV